MVYKLSTTLVFIFYFLFDPEIISSFSVLYRNERSGHNNDISFPLSLLLRSKNLKNSPIGDERDAPDPISWSRNFESIEGRNAYTGPEKLDSKLVEFVPDGRKLKKKKDVRNSLFLRSNLQKRYLCRQNFIYNPVSARCQPNLSALRQIYNGKGPG